MRRLHPPTPLAAVTLAALVVAPALGSAAAGPTSTGSNGSLALTLTTASTTVKSGRDIGATLLVRSTGSEAATAVTACITPPPQLTVTRAPGAQRRGSRVCFTMGDLPAGTEQSRAVTLRAVADRTVTVQIAARASSTCRCAANPSALSPVIRILRASPKPRVTG